ncbi:MAG: TetR family transcriptional regulator, partial [Selenomonadaceae bacterium]|nr:TetR family transcriptional regulator [Selenomonadaceae bacterium]
MKNKIIAAALKEMEIHSLRFTMEDLTRRLHIGRNSLYKVVSSKDALIKSVIDY